MDKPQFTKDISELFDKDCNFNGYSNRSFTEAEKATFLSHLWEKITEIQPIDFSSPQALAAMMAVQRRHVSIQDQMAEFPTQFAFEVEKAKQKGKK